MRPLLLRQVVEELPHTGVLRPARRLFVKATAFHFEHDRLIAYRVEPQWPYQPDGLALHEPFHILPPDQRNVLAEALLIKLDQPAPVAGLLHGPAIEDGRRSREILPQAFGIIGI